MVKKAFKGTRVAAASLGFTPAHSDDRAPSAKEVAKLPALPPAPALLPAPAPSCSWAEIVKRTEADTDASTDVPTHDGASTVPVELDALFEEDATPMPPVYVMEEPPPRTARTAVRFEDPPACFAEEATPRTAVQHARRTLRAALQGVEVALADAAASTVVKNTFLEVRGRRTERRARATCGPALSPRAADAAPEEAESEAEGEASPHVFPEEYDLPCTPVSAHGYWRQVVGVEVWYALCASQQQASALAARVQGQAEALAALEAQQAARLAELEAQQAARLAELEAQLAQKAAAVEDQAARIAELEGKLAKGSEEPAKGSEEPATPRGLRHLTRA